MADGNMTMTGLGAMAIGVLVLIVAFTIIPIVGSQLDTTIAIPAPCNNATEFAIDGNSACPESGANKAGGQWNSSGNTNIVTGVSLWQSIGGILKVGGIVVVVAGFLTTLRGLRS